MEKEQDLSFITGLEGYDGKCSLEEFTGYLNADLSSEKLEISGGWVFSMPERYEQPEYELLYHNSDSTAYRKEIKQKIRSVQKYIAYSTWGHKVLVQFWAAKVDDWGHHYLITSDQPFCVDNLYKGLCWYRKLCMNHCYYVGPGETATKQERLGAVGRVYRNKHPESTPNLRLYSTNEFPLRDYAARCGLTYYLAVPVFGLHNNECYGVLEILSFNDPINGGLFLSSLNRGLQEAELRFTHVHFLPISRGEYSMPPKYKQQPGNEITKMLELAIKAVPQLLLAQVWVPCKQCAEMSNHLSCMQRLAFVNFKDKIVNSCGIIDSDMYEYLQACEFQNIQTERGIVRALMSSNTKSYLCQNLCDIRISENPLAHYAQKARLSCYFAICLEGMHTSDIYIIEFFLQSACREDVCGDFSLQLLSRIMEMELKSYNFALRGQQLSQLNAIQYQSIEYVHEMERYNESYSESDFQKYLQTADLCYQRPFKYSQSGSVFCSPAREELSENDFNSNSSAVTDSIKGKIKTLVKRVGPQIWISNNNLVQFWALKKEEDRCYLATSDQPHAIGCLNEGLALFRKLCMKHHYFVDEVAKEEELGPPGRVFRNGHPEITPDLHLYSTREFSLRNHAAHCCLRVYHALPVFDSHEHKCVGVLEIVGVEYFDLQIIQKAFEATNLYSNHINLERKSFLASHLPANITKCRELALVELKDALKLASKMPQLCEAEVWVPYLERAGINSNLSCMELALSERRWDFYSPRFPIHVATRKGIVEIALASENKSLLCRNSFKFSITEEPKAHYEQHKRLGVCFAICLQSSHTGNLLYVLQLFLNQGPATYEYLLSFLNLLLPIMKQKLKSFKVASGKQLGEELVVEVIVFSEADKLTFSALDQPDTFPVKFKLVQYGHKEDQHTNDHQMQYDYDGIDSVTIGAQEKECSTAADNSKKEDEATKTGKGKGKTGLHLSPEDLIPHFGKRLEDVAEELAVGRSTIKRVLRKNNISRWPNNKKYKKNPSLFMKEIASEIARLSQQNMHASSSGHRRSSDIPLHQNVPQTNTQSAQHLTVPAETEKVIIKLKCGDDVIRLDFCLSSGIDKLMEEVAKKLNLEMGSFKLKYVDDDDDEILLVCDDDLQHCPKSLTAVGKTCIRLFVQLITK